MLIFNMLDVIDVPGKNEPFRYFVGPEGDAQVKLPIFKNCLPETDSPMSLQERGASGKNIPGKS